MNCTRYLSIAFVLIALILSGSLLAGFVPQDEGFEMRRRVSHTIANLQAGDYPMPIESIGDQAHLWSIRRQASLNTLPAENEVAANLSPVQFVEQKIILEVAESTVLASDEPAALVPLLALDGINQPELVVAQNDQFDVLDSTGDPIRFWRSQSLQNGYTPFSLRRTYIVIETPKNARTPRVRLASLPREVRVKALALAQNPQIRASHTLRRAAYQELVNNFAQKYDLDPHLLNAIIQSESNFNPGTVSPKQAVGLMQILPSTAGGEVHRYLHGKRGAVSKAELHNPEVNIRYGTTYLHILNQNYFSGIRDKQAREYCTVAAYNMGPNRVVKSFGSNPNEAAKNINNMSAEQVYQHLVTNLPRKETRNYVAKVRNLKQQYANMQK